MRKALVWLVRCILGKWLRHRMKQKGKEDSDVHCEHKLMFKTQDKI